MVDRGDVIDAYPLTPFQEGLLYHDMLSRTAGQRQRPYFQQLTFRLVGRLDIDAFERSWSWLVARHDMLRSVFRTGGTDRPFQLVLRDRAFRLDVRDLSQMTGNARATALADHVRRERERPFDLGDDLLMRVACLILAPDEAFIIWSFHHILFDGWCIGILQGELEQAYAAYAAGHQPGLAPAPSFKSHVAWVETRRNGPALDFWRTYLKGYEPRPLVPRLKARPKADAGTRTMVPVDLGPDLSLRLGATAKHYGVTTNNLIQMLWGLLLAKCGGQGDVVFGAMVSTRSPMVVASDAIVGPCIAMVPVRIRYDGGETLGDLLSRLHAQTPEWMDNAQCSLADIQACCGGVPLFDHFIVFENYPLADRFRGDAQPFADGLTIVDVESFLTTSDGFHVLVQPGTELRLDFCVTDGAMSMAAATDLAARFRVLAAAAAGACDVPIEDLPFHLPGEVAALLAWSRGADPAPLASNVMQARRDVVTAAAGRPALRSGDQILSHGDVQHAAERLARGLRDHFHVREGNPVALLATPQTSTICAMLACLLLGAPFVPIDPAAPVARTADMLKDCGARILVADGSQAMPAIAGVVNVAIEDIVDDPAAAPLADPSGDAAAYIIYTSGTTGRPKGVRVGQAALLNYVGWIARDLGVSAADRSVLVTSLAHDLGYTALFGSLLLGGCLSLIDEADRRDPEHVAGVLRTHRATWLKLTPAYVGLLLQGVGGDPEPMHDVRLVLVGGEPQRFAELRRLGVLMPDAALYNHYGPTEATIGCVAGVIDAPLLAEASPPQRIGRPIAGTQVVLCDQTMMPVPWGMAGEIVVAGAGLADGYVGQGTDNDAQRFAPVPCLGGARGYRTGDWGEWLADGTIAFLGRRDDQVKVRGHRVALREIEAALTGLDCVRAAVVLAEAQAGETELTGIFVPEPGTELSAGGLRALLVATLPEPMIPSRFVPVSRLPVTSNGKVDRSALQAEARRLSSHPAQMRHGNALEDAMCRLWADVLFREEVGLDDDFFALGGHSIKAVVLVSRIRKSFKRKVTIRQLHEHSTVRDLVRHMNEGSQTGDGLLKLRSAPARAPVALFLPPIFGTGTVYKELVSRFDGEVACFGVQCPGFDRDETIAGSIPELADLFVEKARGLSEAAPIRLVGWSMGAHIALEVAARLERVGRRARLVLIDSAPRLNVNGTPIEDEPVFSDLDELAQHRYWAGVLTVLCASVLPEERARLERLVLANRRMIQDYRFSGMIASDIFCVEGLDNSSPLGMARFGAATSGRCSLQRVSGDHYSMFQPPNVDNLARHVERALLVPD